MKNIFTFIILFVAGLFSVNSIKAKQDTALPEITTIALSASPVSDRTSPTKSIVVDGKIEVYREKFELSKIGVKVEIKIKDAFDLPNTLSIQGVDVNTTHSIVSPIARNISFEFEKSDLKVSDKIIIKTKDGREIVNMEVIK